MTQFKTVTSYIFGTFFIVAGISHFLQSSFFVNIVPAYLPWPRALVYLSGIAEIGLGGLLFFRRWKGMAGWGLIALLIAVFPANLHMALHPTQYPSLPPIALWVRLPLQGVLIAWAYWYTRASNSQIVQQMLKRKQGRLP